MSLKITHGIIIVKKKSCFWSRKESVSSKNAVRLLNKTVSEFSEKWNENLVQNKLISTIKLKNSTTNAPENYEINVKMRLITKI